MNDRPIISIQGVTFSYDGVPALDDATVSVDEGDFIGGVGPNGGGKTTLLKLVLGLLKPQRGAIQVFGRKPEEVRQRVGYVPQNAHLDALFPVNVMDVTLMGRLGKGAKIGLYRKSDKMAARHSLEEVALSDLAGRAFSSLSGGQRQRVLIARALATGSELLLLDEPTASLDQRAEEEFYDLLKNINRRLTVVVVSHDIGFVSQFVNKVICVKTKVRMHPTGELTEEIIREMYGDRVRLVKHDSSCCAGES